MSEEKNPLNSAPDDSQKKVEPKPLLDTPVAIDNRINSVDVLRGFALLGILVINITMFALPQMTMKNPLLVEGVGAADVTVWTVSYVVFFQKFMAIFSMLFGAGLILMYRRSEEAGKDFGKIYYRRLGWLLVIALVHAYFIWWGDILFFYAISGLILYLFRRQSAKRLITLGVIIFFVGSLFFLGLGFFFDFCRTTLADAEAAREAGEALTSTQQSISDIWENVESQIIPSPEKINEEIERYRGGYWDIIISNIPQVLSMQTFVFVMFIMWRVVGLMMIGMGLMKLGVFAAEKSRKFYLSWVIAGFGLGLPIVGYIAYKLISSDFDFIHMFGFNSVMQHFSILLVAAGHIGVVMLICKSNLLNGLKYRLASVGRMALSNYLMHSVVFTLIFYGYGLGLYGRVSYLGLMGFMVGMWIIQLYLSPIWLRKFRFGPAEWLWRSLTYKKKQPMRKAPAS